MQDYFITGRQSVGEQYFIVNKRFRDTKPPLTFLLQKRTALDSHFIRKLSLLLIILSDT